MSSGVLFVPPTGRWSSCSKHCKSRKPKLSFEHADTGSNVPFNPMIRDRRPIQRRDIPVIQTYSPALSFSPSSMYLIPGPATGSNT